MQNRKLVDAIFRHESDARNSRQPWKQCESDTRTINHSTETLNLTTVHSLQTSPARDDALLCVFNVKYLMLSNVEQFVPVSRN